MLSRYVSRRRAAIALTIAIAAACRSEARHLTTPIATVADSADQIMYGVHTLVTADGVLRGELWADIGLVLDEGSRLELRPLRLELRSEGGTRHAVLTAAEGTRWIGPNRMEARGAVVVDADTGGRRLTTPHLAYAVPGDELSSDSLFVLTEPGRTLRGIGFVADPRLTNVRCQSACSGDFGPSARVP